MAKRISDVKLKFYPNNANRFIKWHEIKEALELFSEEQLLYMEVNNDGELEIGVYDTSIKPAGKEN